MSEYKVSNRYAKSLLELSHDKNVLDKVYEDIQLLLETLKENRNLRVMLQSPIIKHSKKKEVLRAVFSNKLNNLTQSFLDILCNKSREYLLYSILQEFNVMYNELKGIQAADITTTLPLNKELRLKIEAVIREVSGKTLVKLTEQINPELIGGFVLKIGDRQIDDSVSGKIKKLRRNLLV
ncbi:MAG: ATP synthase F1 subunit delta [Cyclobacteriaceae bacterium]|nr:ATP synthase F1 subunit delta [Cyclobacteriaceae bacterium]